MTAEIKQDPWKDKLLVSGSGTPKPIVANAIIALREAPIWFGALAFDLLACETWLVKEPPWNAALAEWTPRPWSPQDDMRATFWLQNHGIAVTPATVAQAIETVAHDQEYNPLTDYLSNLEFDGQPRLDTWMSGYLGTAQNEYTAAVGRCSMIAAVARAYMPGCKSDAMPILEGIQGARKSTAVKTLFDPWFTDELADFGSKDAAMQLRGAWGVEVSELDAMSRGEISRVKAFTSRTTDRFRPPYGARVIESPRSCVFWGTTNAEGYLKDETGGRRFWPVKVGKINIEALERDRDQLWAEARALFTVLRSRDQVCVTVFRNVRSKVAAGRQTDPVTRLNSIVLRGKILRVMPHGVQSPLNARFSTPPLHRDCEVL